jgi:membrane fusion protein (multidrug efflux system)
VRWIVAIGLLAGGFTAGLLVPTGRHGPVAARTPNAATRAVPENSAARALQVTAIPARAAPLSEVVSATGTLRADESVELQPETAGKIVAVNFTEGAQVRRGQLLVKLNDADLQATLQRAILRRNLAELKERRLAQLLQTGGIKREDYDAALNELNVQRAEVTITEALIAKTEIRAPFDGLIGLRFVSEGAYVTASTRIATLQAIERLKLDFALPEKYAGRIRLGGPVRFSVPGDERKYEGVIYAVDPRIDANTRTVVLRATYSGAKGALLPGGFAQVEVPLAEIPDAILVPSMAIVPGVSGKDVFIIVDGKATRRSVVTGSRSETSVHVVEGLRPGDRVITSGLQVLREGMPVAADDSPAGGWAKPARAIGAKTAAPAE